MSDTDTNGRITVAALRVWLGQLPEEYQNADLEVTLGEYPVPLKRIVAYRLKDDGSVGVCVNSMGTHLPFDDTMKWEHTIT